VEWELVLQWLGKLQDCDDAWYSLLACWGGMAQSSSLWGTLGCEIEGGSRSRELGPSGLAGSGAGASFIPLRLGPSRLSLRTSYITFSDTAAMARVLGVLLLALVAPAALAAQ
jgi:hypothetical protein